MSFCGLATGEGNRLKVQKNVFAWTYLNIRII